MRFCEVSSSVMSLLTMWMQIVLVANIWNVFFSFKQKKLSYIVVAFITLILAFFGKQLLSYANINPRHTIPEEGVQFLICQPLSLWALFFVGISVLTAINIALNLEWKENHVTPMSIKYCGDRLPVGLCYWKDNGRLIFSNIKMNSLCYEITGEPLLNGNLFYDKVFGERISLSNGSIWNFQHKLLIMDGETIHELVAYNMTKLYRKKESLEKSMVEIRRMNNALREYNMNIDDTVRKEEILKAKMNIHDEMNHQILATTAIKSEDITKTERKEILDLWKQNAVMLCREAYKSNPNSDLEYLKSLGDMLGIKISVEKEVLEKLSLKEQQLFFISAREALANGAKHSKAKNMYVFIEEEESVKKIIFQTDGLIPVGKIREGGGLSNLRKIVESIGGEIETCVSDNFKLIVKIFKEEGSNEI